MQTGVNVTVVAQAEDHRFTSNLKLNSNTHYEVYNMQGLSLHVIHLHLILKETFKNQEHAKRYAAHGSVAAGTRGRVT